MKKIGLVLLVLLNSLMVFGNESISVGILNGPSSIPAAYMMENVDSIKNADLTFEKFADPKSLLPKLIKNEVDIGFLPVNIAAKVYNSGNKAIVLCGISGYGNLKLITKDKSIRRLSDLEGQTIYVAGKGATPEYLVRYILEENQIESVNLDFSISLPPQLVASVLSDKINCAILPEPFVTIAQTKSKDIRVPIDLQNEYSKVSDEDNFPFTVIVATKDFVENHSDLLIEFLNKYNESYKWTVKNPKKAGSLCGKLQLFDPVGTTNAIPKSNYCFEEAEDSVDKVETFLELFLEYAPNAIGGKLPDEDFYFTKEDDLEKDN